MLCFDFIYIYKMETNEIFNNMIETTLQVINKVHEHLTLTIALSTVLFLDIVIFGVKWFSH